MTGTIGVLGQYIKLNIIICIFMDDNDDNDDDGGVGGWLVTMCMQLHDYMHAGV